MKRAQHRGEAPHRLPFPGACWQMARVWRAAAGAWLLAAGVAWAAGPADAPRPVPPELPAETMGTATLAGTTSERVYVADVVISNIADGRLRVFDARAGKLLGMINTGFAGNFALSAKADEIYVATTYLSRGGRGERTDVLEVWDAQTLAFKHEVVLPPKRAQTLSYRGLVSATGNGRFLLVQNATPATSITVVDLQEKKLAGEIATPGCWGTLPSQANGLRFSMLCGDGKVASITLNEQGQPGERTLSEKLFDADTDAWFHTAERIGDRFFFISFKGVITEVDLAGAVARVVGSKNIVSEANAKLGWRPGGYQAFSVHPGGKFAVISMHSKGGEGSHKVPAKQLWVVDLESGKRVAVLPGRNTISLTFSKSGQRLAALDGVAAALNNFEWGDGGKLKLISTVRPAGQASVQLESHD